MASTTTTRFGLAYALLLLLTTASAFESTLAACVEGCQTGLGLQTFAGKPDALDGYYLNLCQNPYLVRSTYACAKIYCSASEYEFGFAHVNKEDCQGYGYIDLLSDDIAANLTDADLAALPRVALDEVNVGVNYTVVPDQHLFDLSKRTLVVWTETKNSHLLYAEAQFWFWGTVVAMGVAYNILVRLRSVQIGHPDGGVFARIWDSIRAHLILPQTAQTPWRGVYVQSQIPPRIESLCIFLFGALNIVLSAVSYEPFEDNQYWSSKTIQLWRYFADRTGYLSYANIVVMWLFGIRNNILLWATGWSYSTFSRFHRWVARVATLEAVLHSVGYTAYSFTVGGLADYSAAWKEEYWYTGAIATITMCLALGFSFLWFRIHYYDLFLLVHIGFALITLVNLFYHTKIFNGEYDWFLRPCVIFWVFDRVVRIGRILFFHLSARQSKASMWYDQDADLIRADVSAIFKGHARPGTNFYVYTPLGLLGWESHPFTLVKSDHAGDVASMASDSSPRASPVDSKGVIEITPFASNVGPSNASSALGERWSFMIRPHRGFTNRLKRNLLAGPRQIHVLLEGPYGERVDLRGFGDALFIIGGTGITVAISAIYAAMNLPESQCPRMRLAWALRNAELARSVLADELLLASKHPKLAIETFVTRQASSVAANKLGTLVQTQALDLGAGRPSIQKLVADAVAGAAASKSRLAVVVCGPPAMADDTRAAVAGEVARGGRVELFVENFAW